MERNPESWGLVGGIQKKIDGQLDMGAVSVSIRQHGTPRRFTLAAVGAAGTPVASMVTTGVFRAVDADLMRGLATN